MAIQYRRSRAGVHHTVSAFLLLILLMAGIGAASPALLLGFASMRLLPVYCRACPVAFPRGACVSARLERRERGCSLLSLRGSSESGDGGNAGWQGTADNRSRNSIPEARMDEILFERIQQDDKLLRQTNARPKLGREEARSDVQARLKDQLILAPLTRGGNLPFRRLCAEFGANVTYSEMAYARMLIKDNLVGRRERSRLYRAPNEKCFGLQIATNVISEGVFAGKLARESGIDFIDLNCGCPTFEVTRRGLGSAILKKPIKLERLVSGIAEASDIPLTVKVRLGVAEVNIDEIVDACVSGGAAAVTIHGRTQQQRYYSSADWGLIEGVGKRIHVPVIGNGDVVTHYEAQRHLLRGGVHGIMTGRGALIKPWLFQEFAEGRTLDPTAAERIGVYRQLARYMREHFGDDAWGRQKAFYFLPWHLGFLFRYRHLPEEVCGSFIDAFPGGLMQKSREVDDMMGVCEADMSPLEQLLRRPEPGVHEMLASLLWDSGSDAEALAAAEMLALDVRGGSFTDTAAIERQGKWDKAEEVPFA